jgi:D-serine deaminase-like pyridoxal phosphate-dependent protein
MSIIYTFSLYKSGKTWMSYNILMTSQIHDSLYYPPVGTPKDQLPTPALLINLPALEFNLSLMSNYFLHKTTMLRPHFKSHKCPIIAMKQIEYGAIGITCAKLSEAEVLVNAGITDVLIANQVVDPGKITRMAKLARCCHIIVAVDQVENLIQIAGAAKKFGTTIHVVIEVDVGLHRSGVQPGEPALKLAKEAAKLSGIHFIGVLGYEGFTMFEVDRGARFKNSHNAMCALVSTSEMIRRSGIPVEIVSAGGTGTYDITGDIPGVTEVEAGSYVFMDTKYNQLGLGFKQSLTLLSMVTSVQGPEKCIIDAGMKVLTSDNGLPEIITPGGLALSKLNEEHGIVLVDPEKAHPEVGTCLEIVPSHVCTTVNLHDRYYVVQDDKLVDIWEITGRGKSQ